MLVLAGLSAISDSDPVLRKVYQDGGRVQQISSSPARERGITRAVRILQALHRHGRPLPVAELARILSAPRSSVYEIVGLLTEAGLLEASRPGGEVFFGRTVYVYGLDYLREHDLLRRGHAEVDRLAAETGETTQLCTRAGGRYTVLHMRPSRRPFRISSDIGTQIPLPWTASGRLLLSHLAEAEIRELIDPADLRLPNGEEIGLEEFLAAVAQAREDGWCITSGLVDAFTHCIAAPLRDAVGDPVATLCFVVPMDTPASRVTALRDELLAASRKLALADRRAPTAVGSTA